MAWQRKIPFGYRMENGYIVPNPDEAEAVRMMFAHYLDGASYLAIADRMTASGVRYHAATPEWNKNMVKRILENARYTGADGWPEIVSQDVYDCVIRLRESKTENWSGHPDCNDAVKRKLVCAVCKAPYRVRTSARDGIRWWHCGNDECGATLKIADAELERNIIGLLNSLIERPETLDMPHTPAPVSPESERIQNELYRELSKTEWNEDYAKSLAFAHAAERYDALGDREYMEQKAADLKEKISSMKPLTAFDREFLCEAVEAVIANADGSLALKLISGSLIENTAGKDENHADSDATHTA